MKVPEQGLVLIRGLPGSGKTTIAENCFPDHVCCEADHYFMTDNGYVFDHSKLGDAHAACYEKARRCLQLGLSVVVANTFTTKWEIEPYFKLAKECGVGVKVIVAKGTFGSEHNVPEHTIQRMKERWWDGTD